MTKEIEYFGIDRNTVLHNLKTWDFDACGRYKISEAEASIIIDALKELRGDKNAERV